MYFPQNMPFQYFFFSTYPGMFLQALPVALVAGLVCLLADRRKHPELSQGKRFLRALFVCYLTGLLCLTLFLGVLQELYYRLLYRRPSGNGVAWFTGAWGLLPTFFFRFSQENLGNLLLFLPFGVLYPLFQMQPSWKRTLLGGAAACLAVELLQPIFGRSFDTNDLLLNLAGICLSTGVFFGVRKALRRQ